MAQELNNQQSEELFTAALVELEKKAGYAENRRVKYIRLAKEQYEEGTPNYNQLIRISEHDATLRNQYSAAAVALRIVLGV